MGTPDAGTYFHVLTEREAAAFFIVTTEIRAILQQDPGAALGKQQDSKHLWPETNVIWRPWMVYKGLQRTHPTPSVAN